MVSSRIHERGERTKQTSEKQMTAALKQEPAWVCRYACARGKAGQRVTMHYSA